MPVRANRMYVAAPLLNASQSFHLDLPRRALDDSGCCSTPGNPALSRISRPNGCLFGHRVRRLLDLERIRCVQVNFPPFFRVSFARIFYPAVFVLASFLMCLCICLGSTHRQAFGVLVTYACVNQAWKLYCDGLSDIEA